MSTGDASWVLMMQHEYSWYSSHDASWMLMMQQICHQMARHARHGTWKDFSQPNIDDFPARIFDNFEICKCSFYNFWMCIVLYFILGAFRITQEASRNQRGSIWRQLGSLGTILCWSDFSRNPKITENHLLRVFRGSVRRTSEESLRNRCPVIFQPSV